MSTMPTKFNVRTITLASLLMAGVAAISAPSIAQIGAEQSNAPLESTMLAQQPRGIGQAINRWEQLQDMRGLNFADYAGFAMKYPDFPRLSIIQLRAEAALDEEAPESADLIAYFDAHPPLTNPARARYALALAGDSREEAFDVARAAWRGGRMSSPAEAYMVGLFGSRFTPEDQIARMDALVWQGEVEAAKRHLVNLPAAQKTLALAQIGLLDKQSQDAAETSVPDNALADPGYLYNQVKALRSERKTGEAITLLASRPLLNRPAFDAADMVGEMLDLAEAASTRSAVAIASKTDDLFAPGTDISAGSFSLRDRYTDLMWLGGTKALWELNDGAAAAPLFNNYGDGARTPLTRSKGFYWAGRAARSAGLEEQATAYFEKAAAYPHYYYGQLAISALGRDMPAFAEVPKFDLTRETVAEFNARPVVQAIRALAADRRKWQTERRFFQQVAYEAKTPAEMRLVADLAVETGLEEMAVVAGMVAGEKGFEGFERLGFPTVPTSAGSNWRMVHAIARQESEFDRTRVSHANARGMMQLLPSTAREQAGKSGVTYMTANLVEDPVYNIKLGDAYFKGLLRQYDGAYPLALAAYNAGGRRVNQWLRLNGDPRRGDTDWVTWVEKIPSNFETRYYVMRVIGNAVSYGHMYPEQAGLPLPVNHFLP